MLHRTLWVITVVSILCVSPAAGEQDPVGNWQSVDFVRNVEDFKPGKKSWRGDLFLKEFQCSETGATSLGGRCVNGWTVHRDGKTKYRYFMKQMDGEEYLFLPWLSGGQLACGFQLWDRPGGEGLLRCSAVLDKRRGIPSESPRLDH